MNSRSNSKQPIKKLGKSPSDSDFMNKKRYSPALDFEKNDRYKQYENTSTTQEREQVYNQLERAISKSRSNFKPDLSMNSS